jgi:DNA-binding transcriptional ArsR family regulator
VRGRTLTSLSLTFAALADPTRRSILTLLAEGEATVNEIAAGFPVSLPAISRHLKVLERAELISRSREAQWRRNRLQAEPFDHAVAWMQQRTRTWHARADRLEAHLRLPADPDERGTPTSQQTPTTADQHVLITPSVRRPREPVFRALTDPAARAAWYGHHRSGTPSRDDRFATLTMTRNK